MIARLTSLIFISHYFSGIFLQFPRPQDGKICHFLYNSLASTSAMAISELVISTLTKGYTSDVIATLKLLGHVARMSLFHSWVTETSRYDLEPSVMSYSSGLFIFQGLVLNLHGFVVLFHRGAWVVDVSRRQYSYGAFPGAFTCTDIFLSYQKFML